MCTLQRESVSAPNNLDPSVEIMEPQNVASSWNTAFCIFFLSCRLSRSNWWYSECILMEGDTHAFCVMFFATQSMASKPPAVTLGCKVYRLWTYENKRDISRHCRLNMLETRHHKLWPQPVWMSRRLTSLSQVWPMMQMSSYDAFDAAQLATLLSTCNILSSVRIRRLFSQSVRICKNVRLDNLFL